MPFQPVTRVEELTLFKNLSPADVQIILQSARQKRLNTDEFFFMQDDPAEAFYILTSGKVRLTQYTADGQQLLLRIIVPVTPFGAVALAENEHYPVSAQALEPCSTLLWPKSVLTQLLNRFPQLAVNAVKILAEHVQEFQQRFTEIATQRVERRLARMILRLAHQTGVKTSRGIEVNLPLSRQDLAEMIGTTLYTVSRTLSHWESQGLIHTSREQIIILYPHGLVKIAEEET